MGSGGKWGSSGSRMESVREEVGGEVEGEYAAQDKRMTRFIDSLAAACRQKRVVLKEETNIRVLSRSYETEKGRVQVGKCETRRLVLFTRET